MGNDYLHKGPMVILAYQKIRRIITGNDETWFEKTPMVFEQNHHYVSIWILNTAGEISIWMYVGFYINCQGYDIILSQAIRSWKCSPKITPISWWKLSDNNSLNNNLLVMERLPFSSKILANYRIIPKRCLLFHMKFINITETSYNSIKNSPA